MKEKLNLETESILKIGFQAVEELLVKESALLDELAKALIDKEELEYDEIDTICRRYGKTPTRRIEFDGLLQRFRQSFFNNEPNTKLNSDPEEKEPDIKP